MVCSTGLPPSFHPGLIRKRYLKFKAVAGHRYNIEIKKPKYGYCDGGVSIKDQTTGQIVARWCHPRRIREYPKECEPVSDEWVSCDAPLEESMKLTANAQYEKSLACRKYGYSQKVIWRWHCLAAHQGHYSSQSHLGHHYRIGSAPVHQDLVQAYKWLSLSANNGNAHTDPWRRNISKKMSRAEVLEAEHLVAEWQPNPAECDEIAAPAEN